MFLLIAAGSCARRDTQPALPQTAILRFENLSSDVSLDWMGRAFSEILSTELNGSPQRYSIGWQALHTFDSSLGPRPPAPGISTESTEALLAGANQIVYGDFSVVNGTLRATATESDLQSHQTRVFFAAGPLNDGIFPVAGRLAHQLGEAHAYETASPAALRHFVTALETPDLAAAAAGFAEAAAADPGYGRAYLFWMNSALARRDIATAREALQTAAAHQASFSPLERASIDLDAAALRGDFAAQLQARRDLARLDPADPNHHRALAEALTSRRDFAPALVEFRRALSIRPEDPAALNMMGYAAAFSGDLPTAIRVLRGYEQMRPAEPNPLDSLGDVHFALGHFAEAEQFYLAAYNKAPAFLNNGELSKAAQARLMTGDIAGATEIFNRYRAARESAHDPAAPYAAAVWLWQTGSRPAAIAAMDALARATAGPLHEFAARADAQAALWLLVSGSPDAAVAHARQAIAESGPATAPIAALVAAIVQPREFPLPVQPALNEYGRAYTLLLNKQFAEAAQVLDRLYQRPSNELDDGLSVLLAWALQETGDVQRAQALLRLTPLPQPGGLPMFGSFYFPRIFALRAAALAKQNHPAEAARYDQVFRKLNGSPDPH